MVISHPDHGYLPTAAASIGLGPERRLPSLYEAQTPPISIPPAPPARAVSDARSARPGPRARSSPSPVAYACEHPPPTLPTPPPPPPPPQNPPPPLAATALAAAGVAAPRPFHGGPLWSKSHRDAVLIEYFSGTGLPHVHKMVTTLSVQTDGSTFTTANARVPTNSTISGKTPSS
jgi:hypothetical protein